jgi:hypothetical protein
MKIIELFLDPEADEGGIDAISIVDMPAHQANFLTFSADDPDVPTIDYFYVEETFDKEQQKELAQNINLMGVSEKEMLDEGWYIESIEPVSAADIENIKQKFANIQSNPNDLSAEDTPDRRVRYKYQLAPEYSGQDEIIETSRDFCRSMVEFNRVFRIEDLIAMTDDCANTEFGCYNILTWRGSYNCRHFFYKVVYRAGRPITGAARPIEQGLRPSWNQPSTKVGMSKEYVKNEFGILAIIDDQPVFSNIDDAVKLAEILGCSGYHTINLGDMTGYMACQEHLFASYDDYPKEAQENACKVIRWRDEHGRDEVEGMTRVGWVRASQLCNREPISRETLARMASFARHKKNSELSPEFKGTPWKDKGYVSWLGWGGDAGIEFAQRKLKEIDEQFGNLSGIEYGFKNHKHQTETELDILGYKTKYFRVCPIAVELFKTILSVPMLDDDVVGMIRSAALQADRVFQIEYEVIQKNQTTSDELMEAILLTEDFKDLVYEIGEELGMSLDTRFMDNHILTIAKYLKEELDIDTSGLPAYVDQIPKKVKDSFMKYGFNYDEEKMEVTGAAIIPNKMIVRRNPITDELYYVFFSLETTAVLADRFMRQKLNDSTSVDHNGKQLKGVYVSESWIVDDPKIDKSYALGLEYPEGTWVVTMKVKNRQVWEQIKQGEYNGFSIEGYFNERLVFN